MGGVLEGVRVLDFGRYIAGPYCATLLAEFGAEVIRVEKRDGSEDRFVAPVGEGGEGALFLQINRNKKCITLDPMKGEGQEVMRRLVAASDVVVANLPPQTLRAMKLDYDSLKAIKPDIILTTATAFGGPGPMSDRVGFDGVGQVMSGSVYMTGAGDPPYRAAVNWVDFGTALHCAFGTLAALIERGKSGRGQIVEGALLATALSFTNATLIEQAVISANRVPTGNLGQTAAPADIYRTRDGWGAVPGDGPSAVHPLGQIDGRGGAVAGGSPLCRRPQARRERPRHQRADGALVRRAHDTGSGGHAGQGNDSGRPCPEPATGARSSAYPRCRLHAGRRLSGLAEIGAGRARRGPAVGNAGRNREPSADARRAYRCCAGGAGV
jgi:crotonobetainyl-CoA:carnitine CoA-transferase CaiB-like acyl-CoA transferase